MPLNREDFLSRYGAIYEASPWVATAVWPLYEKGEVTVLDDLARAMRAAVDRANPELQLALIRAHPELVGRAAIAGDLAEASRREQSDAGLDQCSKAEFDAFQSLNAAYTEKFSFPFIIAVKGLGRREILDAFRQRLQNDLGLERDTAMAQIHRIAAFRLDALGDFK